MRRRLALTGVLIGLALGMAGPARAAGRAPTLASLAVTVARQSLTPPRPVDFLGLALEYPTIPQWVDDLGRAPGVDPVLLTLIRNLDPTGRPILRVGGQSGDRTWWPVAGLAPPAGVTSTLGPAWTQAAHALAGALDARYVLGINLEAGSAAVSATEADRLLGGVGRDHVAAFELGNEPDLYRRTPWYRLLNGRSVPWFAHAGTPIFARPPGYGPEEFVSEVRRTARELPRGIPLAGPDAVDASWLRAYTSLDASPGTLGLLDSHAYALGSCQRDPASLHYPTIANLLRLPASRDILRGAAPYVALAHRVHIPFRIDEMGSVTCNGRAGVSNTMAAGLWVTDALFTAVRGGVDGVNLHTFPESTNGLFDLMYANGSWAAAVHPLYDGVDMFARADPPGARVLALRAPDTAQVRSWATIGVDHRVRVLLINVGAARTAVVHPPSGYAVAAGSVLRMLAPGVAATSGVTIGGRAFGPEGILPAPVSTTVVPSVGGYPLTLPPGSETLLTLGYRSAPARAAVRLGAASRLRSGRA